MVYDPLVEGLEGPTGPQVIIGHYCFACCSQIWGYTLTYYTQTLDNIRSDK